MKRSRHKCDRCGQLRQTCKLVVSFNPEYKRYLDSAAGCVAVGIPVALYYTGKRRRALKEADRLKRYGYRVTVKREREREQRKRSRLNEDDGRNSRRAA